jgi:hypothetical protein
MDCCAPILWPCCDQENLSTFKKIVVTSALECISAYIQYTVYIYIYFITRFFLHLGRRCFQMPNIFSDKGWNNHEAYYVLIHIPTFLVSPSSLVNLVMYPYRYQPMHVCEWLHPGDWAETQFQVIDTRRLGTSECPAHLIGSWLNMNILDPSFERWLYRMISVDIP